MPIHFPKHIPGLGIIPFPQWPERNTFFQTQARRQASTASTISATILHTLNEQKCVLSPLLEFFSPWFPLVDLGSGGSEGGSDHSAGGSGDVHGSSLLRTLGFGKAEVNFRIYILSLAKLFHSLLVLHLHHQLMICIWGSLMATCMTLLVMIYSILSLQISASCPFNPKFTLTLDISSSDYLPRALRVALPLPPLSSPILKQCH